VIGWITAGMFSIGNTKPDRYIMGIRKKNIVVIIACCWVGEIVETRRPRPSADVAFGVRQLGLGLADILGPRAGLSQTQLGSRLLPVRSRPCDRQLGVRCVEPRDKIARFHPVTLVDVQFQQPPANLR
jgi:hypothetical protein